MNLDVKSLWNFADPVQSEERFRLALSTAAGDDAAVLRTQIARTYGLRSDFEAARAILAAVKPELQTAGDEARARYWLELGRTYASAAHSAAAQTAETKRIAREAYEQALAIARSAGLDELAVDTLHMLAFVDTDSAAQLNWGLEALALAQASSQPSAQAWEASLHHNVGDALHHLGRYEEALIHFHRAVALRERDRDLQAVRAARWMVGRTLRVLGRIDAALEIQLRLERERELEGTPSRYVFDELKLLYRAKGDEVRAEHYALLRGTFRD